MTDMRLEFSRRIALSRIGAAGIEQTVAADTVECAALARRLGVPAVASLTCRFRLEPARQGRIAASAELRAELTRVCVVSLEPFETTVLERFRLCFVPEPAAAETDQIDPDAPDELTYAGEQIDLGEAAAEQLALALEPYPRMPGVALPPELKDGELKDGEIEDGEIEDAEPDAAAGPFAALARLRGPGRA